MSHEADLLAHLSRLFVLQDHMRGSLISFFFI
jgi:hypothetical protein